MLCKNPIGKLVEECSENIDGNEMIYNGTWMNMNMNEYEIVCNSRTIYIVLFSIAFVITIGISSTLIYLHWYLKKINFEKTIY